MHPDWLSNAYLVADEEGGSALYVDSGAPLEPLRAAMERWRVRPQVALRTHSHHDHVVHEAELGVPVRTDSVDVGALHVEAIPTPGHSDDMVAFLVNDEVVFTGDTLFKDSVGGGDYEQVRHAVMDVFLALPDDLRILPGHTDETTIGRERESNPFIRYWRGLEEANEPCRVGGEEATLVVWSPDYDGKGKALVRFADGHEAIVGGSRVERDG
jgi:glyoxylase-like metal-dependent hydrolase (beta-lactamase superfamily II)